MKNIGSYEQTLETVRALAEHRLKNTPYRRPEPKRKPHPSEWTAIETARENLLRKQNVAAARERFLANAAKQFDARPLTYWQKREQQEAANRRGI